MKQRHAEMLEKLELIFEHIDDMHRRLDMESERNTDRLLEINQGLKTLNINKLIEAQQKYHDNFNRLNHMILEVKGVVAMANGSLRESQKKKDNKKKPD